MPEEKTGGAAREYRYPLLPAAQSVQILG